MSPHPYKILCFGIVNLLYLLISVIQFFKIIFRRFIHFCKLANFAINLLCPNFSKSISSFRSEPSFSTIFITPSPNFLWNTLLPGLYALRSTKLFFFFSKLFRKLSAVLKLNPVWLFTFFALTARSLLLFILYFFTFEAFGIPYSHLYEESSKSCFLFETKLSNPSNNSLGISFMNLDIAL